MMIKFFTAFREWRRHRATVEALSRLTDLQLRDIGVSRFELEGALYRR